MNTLKDLFEIVKRLRGDGGCSWDQAQSATTMWRCLAEEVYELEEAIAKKDLPNVREELGDILFQLVFIIEIFQEQKTFSLSDVIEQVAAKMIRRHPHVYGDASVNSKEELNRQWESIKAVEKKESGEIRPSVLDAVPKGMPSLLRALKVSKCVVKEGFDWDSLPEVLDCARSEFDEFEAALAQKDEGQMMMEFGDILFTLVNVARFAGFHPETALAGSTAKFEGRYRLMEDELNRSGRKLKGLSRQQVDALWEAAKKKYDQEKL